jgi:hypothetical protein
MLLEGLKLSRLLWAGCAGRYLCVDISHRRSFRRVLQLGRSRNDL